MLSISQKENILVKAGIEVPQFPARRLPFQERYLREGVRVPQEELDADREQRLAAQEWANKIEQIFSCYAAARAEQSLRAVLHL